MKRVTEYCRCELKLDLIHYLVKLYHFDLHIQLFYLDGGMIVKKVQILKKFKIQNFARQIRDG